MKPLLVVQTQMLLPSSTVSNPLSYPWPSASAVTFSVRMPPQAMQAKTPHFPPQLPSFATLPVLSPGPGAKVSMRLPPLITSAPPLPPNTLHQPKSSHRMPTPLNPLPWPTTTKHRSFQKFRLLALEADQTPTPVAEGSVHSVHSTQYSGLNFP